MKLKKRNILYSLLIGLTLMSGVPEVNAVTYGEASLGGVTRKTVTGTYYRGNYAALVKHIGLSSGTVSTHVMNVDFGGEVVDAYCAWYENKTPEMDSSTPVTFYSLSDTEFPPQYAVGAASIMNASVPLCANYEARGQYVENEATGEWSHKLTTNDCVRSMKTTALNLYLSLEGVLAGKTCTDNADRFDNAIAEGWDQFDVFKNQGLTTTAQFYPKYNDDSQPFWKAIYNMVENAKQVQQNYENKVPTLSYVDDSTPFTLGTDGYYRRSFSVTSNYTVTSLTLTVSGVPAGKYKFEDVDADTKTVAIEQETYEKLEAEEKLEDVKISGKAKIDLDKVYIFTTAGGLGAGSTTRCEFQDLIFALPAEDMEVPIGGNPAPQKKTCYKYKTTCDSTECTNTNKNNIRNCSSSITTYQDYTCASADTGNNQYGKLMFTYGSGCSLYCTETAKAFYPGNVYPKVTLGTNLVWPTANGEGLYPLKTEGTLKCQIVGSDIGRCISAAQSTTFEYKNSATGTVTYNDLSENVSVNLKGKCATSAINFVNSTTIEITNKCNYSLDNEGYNAFNKKTLEAVKIEKEKFSSAPGTVVLNTEGFLPVTGLYASELPNLSSILEGKYDLKISNISLGHNGQFTSLLNENEYVCKYQVTDKIQTTPCVCPPGTDHAGKDLVPLLSEANTGGNNMTCADAIEEYCDSCEYESCVCYKEDNTEVDLESCLDEGKSYSTCALENGCTDKEILCDETTLFPGLPLDSCLSDGNSYDDCVAKVCHAYCPPDSAKPEVSLTTCINDKISANPSMDKYDAYDKCIIEEECYKPCTGPACIIYRTISLEIPFVGKNVKDSGAWSSTYSKYYTWMHRGGVDISQGLALYRYPGANWRSPKLVADKIWYNRGYKASELYQEATPLYTINLDPSSIKQIRKYNETHEYSDFTLKCTNGAYCISTFLRDNSFKNADGSYILDRSTDASTCAIASNKTTFMSCYKRKTT